MAEICFKLDLNCFQQKDIWKHHEQIEGSQEMAAANISNPRIAAENKRAYPIELGGGKPLQPKVAGCVRNTYF